MIATVEGGTVTSAVAGLLLGHLNDELFKLLLLLFVLFPLFTLYIHTLLCTLPLLLSPPFLSLSPPGTQECVQSHWTFPPSL